MRLPGSHPGQHRGAQRALTGPTGRQAVTAAATEGPCPVSPCPSPVGRGTRVLCPVRENTQSSVQPVRAWAAARRDPNPAQSLASHVTPSRCLRPAPGAREESQDFRDGEEVPGPQD